MQGLDGMRFLGADPAEPADDVERDAMVLLNNAVVRETRRLEKTQQGR